jgi:hypothetical protein
MTLDVVNRRATGKKKTPKPKSAQEELAGATLGEVLAEKAVGVLVESSLPW